MSPEIRDFIEVYKKKPVPATTFSEFLKMHNHEIWRQCKCGASEDLRKTFYCTQCGKQLDPNFK